MRGSQRENSLRVVIGSVVGGLLLLAMPASVVAQPGAPGAELKRVVGRVEILVKGQTQ